MGATRHPVRELASPGGQRTLGECLGLEGPGFPSRVPEAKLPGIWHTLEGFPTCLTQLLWTPTDAKDQTLSSLRAHILGSEP